MRKRLGDLVPRDARAVLEITGSGQSVAQAARCWNPAARFALLDCGLNASPDGLAARLAGSPVGAFDAAVVHGVADPLPLLGVARSMVRPGGALLAALPDGARPSDADLEALDLAADRVWVLEDGRAVLRAVESAAQPEPLLIQTMTLKPAIGLNEVRVHLPNAFLDTLPGVLTLTQVQGLTLPVRKPGSGHVVVLQRNIAAPSFLAAVRRIAFDWDALVVAEFDDDPDHWPAIAEHGHLSFRAVHAVQTSTPELARRLRGLNPEVAVFPNQLAFAPAGEPDYEEPVVFFGAANREADWQPLMPAINSVLARAGRGVAFEVVHDRAFFDALATERKRFTPSCSYGGYLEALRRCCMAVLPLGDTPFNRAKSDLKFVECAGHGLAVLASPVVYGETVQDGETALLYRDAKDFAVKFERLITDRTERRRLGQAGQRHVFSERLMAWRFKDRIAWYRSLLARKPALDAALLERVPGVAKRVG